eukprot:SAG31_NODE_5390_length_2566_cov_1.775030_1_plen_219_part_00
MAQLQLPRASPKQLLQDFEREFRSGQSCAAQLQEDSQLLWKKRAQLAQKHGEVSKRLNERASKLHDILKIEKARKFKLKQVEAAYAACMVETQTVIVRSQQEIESKQRLLDTLAKTSGDECALINKTLECVQKDMELHNEEEQLRLDGSISSARESTTSNNEASDVTNDGRDEENDIKLLCAEIDLLQSRLSSQAEEKLRHSEKLTKCRGNLVRPPNR